MKIPNRQSGLIHWIALVVILVLVLSYFNIDLRGLVENEQTKENFAAVWGWVVKIWNNYLKKPARFIWKEIIVPFVLEPLKNLREEDGEPASDDVNSATTTETAFLRGEMAIC